MLVRGTAALSILLLAACGAPSTPDPRPPETATTTAETGAPEIEMPDDPAPNAEPLIGLLSQPDFKKYCAFYPVPADEIGGLLFYEELVDKPGIYPAFIKIDGTRYSLDAIEGEGDWVSERRIYKTEGADYDVIVEMTADDPDARRANARYIAYTGKITVSDGGGRSETVPFVGACDFDDGQGTKEE